MSTRTLVLTPWMFPKEIIGWEKAVTMKYERTVDVLAEYAEEVCSPTITWRIPAVVRVLRMPRHYIGVRYSRRAVLIRDRFTCQYCGHGFPERKLTRDHVFPRSRGGPTTWENTCAACRPCQIKKADRTCAEARMYPLTMPTRPMEAKTVLPRMPDPIPIEWVPFVFA